MKRTEQRVVVYTAVVGDRDPLRPPERRIDHVDYICFTDDLTRKAAGWTLREVEWFERDPIRTARRHKLLSHRYLADYTHSLWVDANILPACDPGSLIEQFSEFDLVVHTHPHRRCVYDEIAACIGMHKDLTGVLRAQEARYRRAGLPAEGGLYETGVVLRKHSPAVSRLNECWWQEVLTCSARDQIALPYALREEPVALATFPFELRNNDLFRYYHHDVRPHPRYRAYLATRRWLGKKLRTLSDSLKR